MENRNCEQQASPTLRELYPTLTETELTEAEANFRRYIEIAADIQKEQAVRGTGFDTPPNPATIRERSNASLKT
jgi:hypothetical protein